MGYDALQIKNKKVDIGYDINSYYWRKGFATEAINKVIKFGFREEGLLREYIIQNDFFISHFFMV